jgi:hypothetical protein
MSEAKKTLRQRIGYGLVNRLSGGALDQQTQTIRRKTDQVNALNVEIRDIKERTAKHQMAQGLYINWQGVPRTLYGGGPDYDYIESNMLATTPTPRMCIQRKKFDIANTPWEIVPLPKDGKDKPDNEAIQHAKQISEWLYFNPNRNYEPFRHILAQLSDDLDKHDAAALQKTYGRNGDRHLVEISARDGALFRKDVNLLLDLGVVYDNYTMDNKVYHNLRVGYWYNWDSTPKIAFEPHEIAYIMEDPRTDIPYGTSRCATLRAMLLSMMYDSEFYNEYGEKGFKNPCIIGPDVVSSTTSSGVMNPTEFQSYKESLKTQLEEYMTKAVTNSKTSVSMLSDMKAMQWLETKTEYRQIAIANFNLTPAAIGYTKDLQKSTETSQLSLYIQRGLWPRLKMIEWYMNSSVIADWFWTEKKETNIYAHGHKGQFADKPMDVMFRFKLLDPIGDQLQLDIDDKKLRSGLTTINAVLKQRGEDTVKWGDVCPLFFYNPQQFGQSYAGGSMTAAEWKRLIGIEPGVKQVVDAVQPKVPEESESNAADQLKQIRGYGEPIYATKMFCENRSRDGAVNTAFKNTSRGDYSEAAKQRSRTLQRR